MTTLSASPTGLLQHHEGESNRGSPLVTRALLACGVLYAVVYIVANDVIAASQYAGYSRLDQAVSELSATGAPTAAFLRAMLPVFTALMLAYGVGVWRAAGVSRAFRTVAVLLLGSCVVGVSWLWFPMTSREEMTQGPMAANDVGHLVLSGLTVTFILLQMGFGAAGVGTRRFTVFTVVCAVTMLGFGAVMSSLAREVPAPTPWMGLYERVMLAGWLAWISTFAVVLGWVDGQVRHNVFTP